MIVTFSGIDGSGKSTAAKHAVTVLGVSGIEAQYLRFRLGTVRLVARPDLAPVSRMKETGTAAAQRWRGFSQRSLTAVITCGYIARICVFRLFGPSRSSARWYVVDRYFYDSFMHYELKTARERLYLAVLRHIIPRPDLAVLLMACPETIAERRPNIAREFLQNGRHAYERLRLHFPELVEIRTDEWPGALSELEALIHNRLTIERRCLA